MASDRRSGHTGALSRRCRVIEARIPAARVRISEAGSGALAWRGARSPRQAPHTPPGRASGRPGAPHFAHSRTRRGGRVSRTASGGSLPVRRARTRAAGWWTGRRQAGGQGADDGLVRGPSGEPVRHQRSEHRAVGLGEGQGGGRAAEGGEQDVGAGAGGTGCGSGGCSGTSPRVNVAHQSSSRAVRENHDRVIQRGLSRVRQVFAAPAQVPCPLEVVEGGAESALSVRQRLGQRLYGDVGAVGETVDVRGDGGFAGWEVGEVVGGAGGVGPGRSVCRNPGWPSGAGTRARAGRQY